MEKVCHDRGERRVPSACEVPQTTDTNAPSQGQKQNPAQKEKTFTLGKQKEKEEEEKAGEFLQSMCIYVTN